MHVLLGAARVAVGLERHAASEEERSGAANTSLRPAVEARSRCGSRRPDPSAQLWWSGAVAASTSTPSVGPRRRGGAADRTRALGGLALGSLRVLPMRGGLVPRIIYTACLICAAGPGGQPARDDSDSVRPQIPMQ